MMLPSRQNKFQSATLKRV